MPFQTQNAVCKFLDLFANLVPVHFTLAQKCEDNHFRAALLHLEIYLAHI
ncbi:MAG: hypothetical protein WB562_00695 [Candidatus Sulfotelmatobacter sp.]